MSAHSVEVFWFYLKVKQVLKLYKVIYYSNLIFLLFSLFFDLT